MTDTATPNTNETTAERIAGGAREAGQRASEALDSNPFAVLAGGVALGMLIGAALPRTRQEREALRPLGERIASGASAAVQAAREAGKAEIDALIPDRDATRDRIGALIGSVTSAARDAASRTGG